MHYLEGMEIPGKIDAVILENRELKIVVLPGKGTDISEITHKPKSRQFANL